MPQLGILEGRMLAGAHSRGLFGGTIASSRSRRSVGPALFGEDSNLASWIYNAKSFVNTKWYKIENDQITRTGKGLDASQQAAYAAELAAAEQSARASYAAQSGSSTPPPTGQLSVAASNAAGRGRAADAMYNQAKAAALAAGLSASAAESVAVSAGRAVAAGLAYDVAAAISATRLSATTATLPVAYAPAPDPTASTPLPILATREQIRQYYESPAAPVPAAPADAAPPAPSASPEDILRHTFSDTASAAPSAAPTAKAFLIPVAALAAAYFFLKG